MNPQRFREIDRIFQAAMDLPDADRTEFLDLSCGSDVDLRRQVESLLQHDRCDTSLERVVRQESEKLTSLPDPQQVGPYRLTEVIGRGGMGVVYVAVRDDDVYRKRVAVKLVKRGMDTDFVLARFKSERRILARLAHTHIAQLLDGGSAEDGRPFFVMELVEGEPITDYCDRLQLSVPARLRLFLDVCAAVQHAHQNMVVHRDLKPSNILVTADGTVKLLDFGIAKVLQAAEDESIQQTALGLRMMTPAYASPEQVLARPVSTASDVYSLGAVLYELLSGHRAHRVDSLGPREIEKAICEEQPPPPSQLAPRERARALAGDLDNIVLMALRKEPERRYATADQFAADLRRLLENRPVHAHADTFRYRAGKFVRRNRMSVAAALVVCVSLSGATAVSIWHARRAEHRFEQVRKLAGALLYDVHDQIRDLPGSTRARQRIVTIARQYLDALEHEAAGDTSLQRDLAAAYVRVGDVQGGVLAANLGDVKGALASYERARKLMEDLPRDADTIVSLAALDGKIGDALEYHGDLGGALASYARGKALLVQAPDSTAKQSQLAATYHGMAHILGIQRDEKAALEHSRKALAIRQALANQDHSFDMLDRLADAESELSMSLQRISQLQEALAHARRAVELRESQLTQQPNHASVMRSLILAYSHVADVVGNPTMPSLGDTAAAIELYRKMTTIAQRLTAADPSDRRAKIDLANCLLRLGSALVESSGSEEAVHVLESSAATMRQLSAAEPKNNRIRLNLAFVQERLGIALANQQRSALAMESYQKAIDLAKAALTADPAERTAIPTLADTYMARGMELAKSGNFEAAVQSAQHAIEILDKGRKEHPKYSRLLHTAAKNYAAMGSIHRRAGSPMEACAWLEKSNSAYQECRRQEPLATTDLVKFEAVQQDLAGCRLNRIARR